jgi:hypothetical protein
MNDENYEREQPSQEDFDLEKIYETEEDLDRVDDIGNSSPWGNSHPFSSLIGKKL